MQTFLKIVGISLLLSLSLLLSGCHTTAGFGKDLQAGGKHIEKAAEKNK
jgi:entericidin B